MRKGARTRAEVPTDVLAALNAGTEQTLTLPEMLVMDFAALLRNIRPDMDAGPLAALAEQGVTKRMAEAGRLILPVWRELADHPSDTVRGWCAFAVGLEPDCTIERRLELIRPFADDAHFGVREWAWLGIRTHVCAEPAEFLRLLRPWTQENSAFLRRFASETTRPRGVWCAHIRALRADPRPAAGLLSDLSADPDRYVQNSVANWLNDAAKDHPDWVRALCADWAARSPGKAIAYIIKRAQRGLT